MVNAKAARQRRREFRESFAALTFWHGGVGGLQSGQSLRSPAVTHDPASVALYDSAQSRPDRVYFTTDRELARAYASIVMRGTGQSALYQVTPLAEFEIDPDFPTVGFQAARARIVEVAEAQVEMTRPEEYARQQPYTTWIDGRLIWDEAGRVQLSAEAEALGITQQRLDQYFPLWPSPDEVVAALNGHPRDFWIGEGSSNR